MGDNAEKPATPGQEPSPALVTIEFPTRLNSFVVLSMGIGAALTAAAIVCELMGWQSGAKGSLLFAAGISIILAAFGGQATVRGKVFVIAGVAAIAVALTYYLEYRRDSDSQARLEQSRARSKEYVRGNVHNVPPEQISLRFGNTVVGNTYLNQRDVFSFIVQEPTLKEVRAASLKIDGDKPVSISIDTSCIERAIGTEHPIDWTLKFGEDGSVEVLDQFFNDEVVGRFGPPKAPPCPMPVAAALVKPSLFNLFGITAAFADKAAPGADKGSAAASTPRPTPVELDKLGADLKSDNTVIRRGARDALSILPPDGVTDILSLLKQSKEDYRTQLGVSVALTEMLRRDKDFGNVIRPALTDDDRNLLLDLSGNKDRTVRIYATEFLFDLGDPSVTKLAIARAATTDNDDARYNWLLAAQDGWQRLSFDEKVALRPDVDAVFSAAGPKTKQLAEPFKN